MRQRSGWILKGCCSVRQVPWTGRKAFRLWEQFTQTSHSRWHEPKHWQGWPIKIHALTESLGCWKAFVFISLSLYLLNPSFLHFLSHPTHTVFHSSYLHVAIISPGVDLSLVKHTPTASQANSLTFLMPQACNLWFLSFPRKKFWLSGSVMYLWILLGGQFDIQVGYGNHWYKAMKIYSRVR